MTWRAERGPSGFTLIEMIVVLAVLGFTLALIVGRGPMHSRALTTRAAASELAGALREARARAISQNQSVAFTLDIKHKDFRVGDAPMRMLPPELALSLLTTTGEVRNEAEGDIRFDPDGSSTGGRIVLVDNNKKIQVGVDWLTGRVSVVNAP
jgi:general secretion pathway protein H